MGKKFYFELSETDVTLIATLLQKHCDLALAKSRFYAYCNGDGSYNGTLAKYKKLISRYNRLLAIIHV